MMSSTEIGTPLLPSSSFEAGQKPRRIPDEHLARLKLWSSLLGFFLGSLAPFAIMASVVFTVRVGLRFHWNLENEYVSHALGLAWGLLVTLLVFSSKYTFLHLVLKPYQSSTGCHYMESIVEGLVLRSSLATLGGVLLSWHITCYFLGFPLWNGMVVAISSFCAAYCIYSLWCCTGTLDPEDEEEENNGSYKAVQQEDDGLKGVVTV